MSTVRRLAAVLVLFWSAWISAQGPSGAAIAGRVVAAGTGEPLRHARVTLTAAGIVVPTLLTDDRGAFVAAGLPTGRYTLTITKPGYIRMTTAVAAPSSGYAADATIELSRAAAITGTAVFVDTGEPAAGIPIAAARLATQNNTTRIIVAAMAESDDNGAFRIGGLNAGSYVVLPLVTASGGLVAGQTDAAIDARFSSRLNADEAPRVEVKTGDETGGILVAAPRPPGFAPPLLVSPGTPASDPNRTSTFRGRVMHSDGTAAAGVQVLLMSATTAGGAGATSDSRGLFEITMPPLPENGPTDFRLVARKAGFAPAEYGQRRVAGRGTLLHLAPGEVQDHLDMTLVRLGVIAGRLVDDLGEPVEGAVVRAMQVRYVDGRRRLVDVGGSRRSDDHGRFRLFGLRPGHYAVAASVGTIVVTQSADDLPGFGTTYYPGTTDPSQIAFVSLPPGQEVADVDFPLSKERTFRVAGRAWDVNGDPVTGGIALLPRQRSAAAAMQLGARISRDGAFEFRNVPRGDYVLQISRGGGRAQSSEGEFVSEFVTLADRDVTDLELQTGAGSTITGTVLADSGQPLPPGAIILSAMPADLDRTPQIGTGTARAIVDDEGRFELEGINGPRRLQVVRAPKGWALKEVRVQGTDVTDAPLSFGREEESLEGVEVVLTSAVTRITGSVSPPRGAAPSDFTVIAFAADRDRWYLNTRYAKRAVPSTDGTYTIEGLPPADYYVAVAETPDDPGEWQDPRVLDALALRATRVRLPEGETVSLALKTDQR